MFQNSAEYQFCTDFLVQNSATQCVKQRFGDVRVLINTNDSFCEYKVHNHSSTHTTQKSDATVNRIIIIN